MKATGELPAEAEGAGAEPAGDGAPQQLADMRWVYERPASQDRTQGHKTCRKWLKSDVKGFMAHKSRLEGKLLARGDQAARRAREEGSGGVAAPSPGLVVEPMYKPLPICSLCRRIGYASCPACRRNQETLERLRSAGLLAEAKGLQERLERQERESVLAEAKRLDEELQRHDRECRQASPPEAQG